MKVGVFLPNVPATAGGAFAFQQDILEALAEVDGRHTFVILGDSAMGERSFSPSDRVLFVSSGRIFMGRVPARLIRSAVRAASGVPLARNWLGARYRQHLTKRMVGLGIEFVWFVTPSYVGIDIPYIFTVWDLQHRLQPWFPEVSANGAWQGRETMYATAIPRASAVIVGTEAGKAEVIRFYGVPPERVRLIPLPTPRFALEASKDRGREVLAKYQIPAGYLFYPAQFWPHKNHVGLLCAVKILREKHGLTLPVVFVGSDKGNLQHVRRVVDELGLTAQVHFLGFVPQDDLAGLYRNAFALTFPTFFGPDNLPPLEAFALGCPVIASNVSGAQEQLGDAALLVDPRNEQQVAIAVKSLYEDLELRRTLVQRGLKRASRWTGQDFVKSVFSILDELEPVRRCWSK